MLVRRPAFEHGELPRARRAAHDVRGDAVGAVHNGDVPPAHQFHPSSQHDDDLLLFIVELPPAIKRTLETPAFSGRNIERADFVAEVLARVVV